MILRRSLLYVQVLHTSTLLQSLLQLNSLAGYVSYMYFIAENSNIAKCIKLFSSYIASYTAIAIISYICACMTANYMCMHIE